MYMPNIYNSIIVKKTRNTLIILYNDINKIKLPTSLCQNN